jgi:hypothetical protein
MSLDSPKLPSGDLRADIKTLLARINAYIDEPDATGHPGPLYTAGVIQEARGMSTVLQQILDTSEQPEDAAELEDACYQWLDLNVEWGSDVTTDAASKALARFIRKAFERDAEQSEDTMESALAKHPPMNDDFRAGFERGWDAHGENRTSQADGRPKISIDAALRLRTLVESEPGVNTTFNLVQVEAWLDAAGIDVNDDRD